MRKLEVDQETASATGNPSSSVLISGVPFPPMLIPLEQRRIIGKDEGQRLLCLKCSMSSLRTLT